MRRHDRATRGRPRRTPPGRRSAEPRGTPAAGPGRPEQRPNAGGGSGSPREFESERKRVRGEARPIDRSHVRGVSRADSGELVLQRFLRSLAARDASPHTQRAYATAVGRYLDWLAARGVDWRSPTRTDLRAYLAALSIDTARSSVAQRLAAIRAFHRFAVRGDLAAGDPWGAIATPRLPRRLPRVLEVQQVERLLAVIDDELSDARSAELAVALALRDRAIVEVAYAAGLRISELA